MINQETTVPDTQPNNLALVALAGFVAMLGGAAAWAIVTVMTQTELGLMAIAVGFLVGIAIRKVRNQPDRILGIMGALFALGGCLLGNAASMQYFFAQKFGIPYEQALFSPDLGLLVSNTIATFDPMDLIFYAIAIYEGFKFSSR